MTKKKEIRVKVYRSPSQDQGDEKRKGTYRDYAIPYHEGISVLEVLDYIYKKYDTSLSFYYSCRIGKCLGCYVDINGKPALACATPAKDKMTIGPHKKFNLIRDLVVDFR